MSLSTLEQQWIPDVTAASNGDVNAYERLVRACQNSVSSIALAIVKDLDASEDISQQVFIHIWQHLASLQNPASFLPWVRQITRYRAFNYLRDHKVATTVKGDEAETLLDSFANGGDLQDEFARDQQNRIMQDFISQLPEESREIVLLFYREDQNSQQVATLLGLTESNVRKKLQRVRELLKQQLLAKYGRLILTTAPGLGLTSAICAALTVASPPVAAATAITASSKSGGGVKLLMLLGGAMIGALAGLIGVIAGMQQPIKRASTAELKTQLVNLRNKTIAWVLASGLLLTAAYELTAGGWAPICAFTLFVVGLVWFQATGWQLLLPDLKAKGDAAYRKQRFWCIAGMLVGYGAGFAGLIVGLINNGRL